MLRVASWNINSIRLRLPLLARFAAEYRPDVVCLQETKVMDELFPSDDIKAMGFPHIAICGQKSYNGVALLSKRPIADIRILDWCGKNDCRHIAARIDGVDIHSLYIPAGGDIPDPDLNPKFAHKLDFVRQVTQWCAQDLKGENDVVLAGDFNIAPLETDVWSHKQLLSVVSHTPIEVDLLGRLQASIGWVDAVRRIIPQEQKLYSWWSYRSPDWTKNDRGRRLDHIWVSPSLSSAVRDAHIVRDMRAWDVPSDHVPVLVDLERR